MDQGGQSSSHGDKYVPLVQQATYVATELAAAGHKDGAVMIGRLARAVAELAGHVDGLASVIRILKHRLKEAEGDYETRN